jgi:AraC-like DNA-binding protein
MSRDGHAVGAVVFGEFDLSGGTWFPWHRHATHQLAWTSRSALTVNVGDAHWVLPPSRALWLPAGVQHRTGAARATVLRGIYIDPVRCPVDWPEPTMVEVSPLLRELLDYLAGDDLGPAERDHGERLAFDLLRPVRAIPIGVRRPPDERAATIADLLTADPADSRSLSELAAVAGMSARTLARLFLDGTGGHVRRLADPGAAAGVVAAAGRRHTADRCGVPGRVRHTERLRRRLPARGRCLAGPVLPLIEVGKNVRCQSVG